MSTASKTLSTALNELLCGLWKDKTVCIGNMNKTLAEELPRKAAVYFLPHKVSIISLKRQEENCLYSAEYTLIEAKKQKKGA